jgi:carbon starvation protein
MEPNLIYASGLANYLGLLGVSFGVAFPFALLAFSTFVYDTLDVSTRLARYIFQELTGWRGLAGSCLATAISLAAPLVFLLAAEEKAYKLAWPIFGTSNQMLASLTLLAVCGWLIGSGKRAFYVVGPMLFMLVTTMTALVLQIQPFVASLPGLLRGTATVKTDAIISGVCGSILLVLGGLSALSACRALLVYPSRRAARVPS